MIKVKTLGKKNNISERSQSFGKKHNLLNVYNSLEKNTTFLIIRQNHNSSFSIHTYKSDHIGWALISSNYDTYFVRLNIFLLLKI